MTTNKRRPDRLEATRADGVPVLWRDYNGRALVPAADGWRVATMAETRGAIILDATDWRP